MNCLIACTGHKENADLWEGVHLKDARSITNTAERLVSNWLPIDSVPAQAQEMVQVSEWVTRWGDSRIGCGLIQHGKHLEVCHDGCDFVAG